MKVSELVKRSVHHIFHVSKCSSNKELRHGCDCSKTFPGNQVQEPKIIHGPKEADQGGVKEESASVGMGCEGDYINQHGSPKLNPQCPRRVEELLRNSCPGLKDAGIY